jgi:hypothetical protein
VGGFGGRLTGLAQTLDVPVDYLVIDTAARRPLRAPEKALGDRLAAIAELDNDALTVLTGVIDGLLARTRLTTLTADVS